MRMLGGWIALTPELSAKLLLGRHVWDCAQHADLWGKRLPELRSPAQQGEAPGEAFDRFLATIESPEALHQTPERLVPVKKMRLTKQAVKILRLHSPCKRGCSFFSLE